MVVSSIHRFYADPRLVTGGSSGLGAATAIRFANSGARVVVSDLKSAGIEKQITDKHGKDSAIFVKVDVTKEDEIEHSQYLLAYDTNQDTC